MCAGSVCIPAGCGNSFIEAGEDCDDGNQLPGDGCSGYCTEEVCGNGVVDLMKEGQGLVPAEECGDGNNNLNHDGCTNCLEEMPDWQPSPFLNSPSSGIISSGPNDKVIFLGRERLSRQSVAWQWNGDYWTKVLTHHSLPELGYQQPAMAYDASRK